MMYFYLKSKIETAKNDNDVYNLLKSNKEIIDQQLKKSFFLKLGCFSVTLNDTKKELKICRLFNPFWDYTILNIASMVKGSVIEIKSVPQPFYYFILLLLMTVLFGMVAFSLNEILFMFLAYIGLVLILIMHLLTKYRSFYILSRFCKNIFA